MENGDEDRRRRLAQSLRDNLRRRKSQTRDSGVPGSENAPREGDTDGKDAKR